ncbi:MAG TPA: methionine adenosyltransferase domain-containing protein, partial [Exilispira sp.]|nr:methionine adenosyltransferase domain-containing protein [Exilispira sp.]
EKCELELAYAIGVAMPVSINLNFFGTGKYPEESVVEIIKKVFPLKPKDIITVLDLQKPIYLSTSIYGHFGRDNFSWEKTDKVEEILKELKK